MNNRIIYPDGHWIRSDDKEKALESYLVQQSKTYSRIKIAFIKELLGNLEGKDFLDYGCGGGMFLLHGAEERASSIVGVDGEEKVLETAKYFLAKRGFPDRCEFICSEHMSYFPEEKKFDAILIKDVIEHVKDDGKLLKDTAKLLKDKGFAVISTQNAFSMNYIFEGTWEYMVKGNNNWCGWDPTHLRFYTPGSLCKKLKNAGLKPLEWRSTYIVPYKFPSFPWSKKAFIRMDFLSIVDKIFGRIFPFDRMGWNIAVKAVLDN